MGASYTREQAIAAFWAKVKVRSPDECWLWQGAKSDNRYGHVSWEGKSTKAHRVAFFLSGAYLAEGEKVCHTCDTPLCCNPRHLFAGTQKANIEDAVRKGRIRPYMKLSAADVSEIREHWRNGWRQAKIAQAYGIHQSNVSNIVTGKTWKHL
jgi:predicted XRE-type DNA-binding protein